MTSRSFLLAPRIGRLALSLQSAGFATFLAASGLPVSAAAPTPPPPKVTVAPVEERILAEYEEITGRVDAAETVELRARVSGHLEAVRFQAGQDVAKGDILFSIDPRWYRAQFDFARAQVEQARARLSVAEREAQRATELLTAAAISREESDARQSRALEAHAALSSAEASLATAQLDLEHTEVRAPIAGRISRAYVTEGNMISGSNGSATLLATIVSTGDAFVYADLDEAAVLRFNRLAQQAGVIGVGGRVPAELQLADETGYPRRGYIESVDNRLNPSTGSLVLRFVFPNSDGALIPGLFARVRVPVTGPHRMLLISDRSIGTDQSQKFVFAVGQDNTVVYRPVKLGGSIDGKRVVRDGLAPGDQVVVNGIQRIRPGMTVAPEQIAVSPNPVAVPAKQVASR